jgi:hypothetical protein
VLQQLRLPAQCVVLSDKAAYCNCSFARALHAETTLEKGDWAYESHSGGDQPYLFVHYAGEVTKLTSGSTDDSALIDRALAFAQETFGNDVKTDMCFNVLRSNVLGAPPIVTLCSKSRHQEDTSSNPTSCEIPTRLDIHTAEAPISTPLSGLTVAEMGLEDVMIDGVLNVYAVARKEVPSASQDTSLGMAAIFEKASHWEPEVLQSERGMALFLSTLRVFCTIPSHNHAEPQMKDAILELFHRLTNFPPCVRALHILLRGETPAASECAAVSQAMYVMH